MTRLSAGPGAAGFTLVEILVVVVLGGVLGATAVNLFRAQTGAFRRANRSAEVDQNVRAGLDLMLRELRNAGMRDPLQPYVAPPGLLAADARSIRFTSDFHGAADPGGGPDGDVLDGNEDVEYGYTTANRTLRRRTRGEAGDSGAQPLAEFVTDLRFTYFGAAGDTISVPVEAALLGSVRRIQVRLAGAAADGTSATVLETDVVPRNLAY